MMTGSDYKHIKPNEIGGNVFDKISKEWMLITAKDKDSGKYNTMTASWGTMGFIWDRPVLMCVIRPQRYTREFTDNSDIATFTFFDKQYRDALNFCGVKSGRDYDKAAETGLTPCDDIDGTIYFNEANLVIVGKKFYKGTFDPESFMDPAMPKKYYPIDDFHAVYYYEIIDVLIKEEK